MLGFECGYGVRGLPFENVRVPFGIAIAVCCVGIAWRVWGTSYLGAGVVFNTAIVTHDLNVSGPYRYTRNPLYLGLWLYALGIALVAPWLTIAVVVAGIGILQGALIRSEEARLLVQFGERYRAYVLAVPRLVPSLRPRVPDAGLQPSLVAGLRAEAGVIALAVASFAFAIVRGR